jgi:hypothetical protein
MAYSLNSFPAPSSAKKIVLTLEPGVLNAAEPDKAADETELLGR